MNRDYVRGTLISLSNIIAGLGIMLCPLVLAVMLVIRIFSPSGTTEVRVPVEPKFVRVNYQVQYGSIYTGDQTLLIYRGAQELPIVDGLGPNGLPIAGYFPTHADLPLSLYGGRNATLHVPCMEAESVNSYLEIRGTRAPVYLSAMVTKGSDGTIFLRAVPMFL